MAWTVAECYTAMNIQFGGAGPGSGDSPGESKHTRMEANDLECAEKKRAAAIAAVGWLGWF